MSSTERTHDVTIYTDGACIGNPGPGGYGAVLIGAAKRKEISGGFRHTTNNRMEIMAALAGLEALKLPCNVTLYTDSRYLANSITKGWALRWRRNGWKRTKTEYALNPDLWQRMLDLCERHNVRFVWVKGHAGNKENERCDFLSTSAAQGKDLAIDAGYENPARMADDIIA